jgi:hypothetical protein
MWSTVNTGLLQAATGSHLDVSAMLKNIDGELVSVEAAVRGFVSASCVCCPRQAHVPLCSQEVRTSTLFEQASSQEHDGNVCHMSACLYSPLVSCID